MLITVVAQRYVNQNAELVMDVVSVDDDTPEKLALEYAANVALRLFPPEDGYFRRYVYIKEQKLHGTTNTD